MRQPPNRAVASVETVGRYAEAFRDLVNAKVWGKNASPSKALRLNTEADWEFICVAMDVVGDAVLAIQNFLAFSLDGPTKYDNVGERYLRLYGVLNAAYLQQEAVKKLFLLMQCSTPKDVDKVFADLELRTLRHQVGSHSVDYRVPGKDKEVLSYVPVRIGLNGFDCMVTEGRGNSTRTVQLDEAIKAHSEALATILDRIYEKSISTLFKGHATKVKEFSEELHDLREQRDGNMIIKVIAGTDDKHTKMKIKFVAASHSKAE